MFLISSRTYSSEASRAFLSCATVYVIFSASSTTRLTKSVSCSWRSWLSAWLQSCSLGESASSSSSSRLTCSTRSLVCLRISFYKRLHLSSMKNINCFSVSRLACYEAQYSWCQFEKWKTTYLSFFFKPSIYDVFKLLDLLLSDAPKLISEFSVFVDKLLNHIHLLVQLVEFRVGQSLGIWQPVVKRAYRQAETLKLWWHFSKTILLTGIGSNCRWIFISNLFC